MINKDLTLSIYLIETEFHSNFAITPTRSRLAEDYKATHEKTSLDCEKTLANPLKLVYNDNRRA